MVAYCVRHTYIYTRRKILEKYQKRERERKKEKKALRGLL